jgi:hypothetical protein
VVLDDLALRLILQLEEFTRAAATAAGLPKTLMKGSYPLSSPHDRECLLKLASGPDQTTTTTTMSSTLSSLTTSSNTSASNVAKITSPAASMLVNQQDKRMKGRLNKLLGDYCLLACASFDAARYYLLAIGECSSNGDAMWHAGAIMGLCSALVEVLTFRHPLRPHRRQPPRILFNTNNNNGGEEAPSKKTTFINDDDGNDNEESSGSMISARSVSSGEMMSPTQRHLLGEIIEEEEEGGGGLNGKGKDNASLWKGSGDKLLLVHLEELCKVV